MDSKLVFRIQEIPEGKSDRHITLGADDLEFEDGVLEKAELAISFERTLHFINVSFEVGADVVLTCDRSLDTFPYHVDGKYDVLFKPEVEEASESEHSKVKSFDVQNLTLSIDPEVRDTIVLGLPVKKLHPRFLDEQGNPMDFETRKFGDENEEDPVDPRWEALKKLKNN